MSREGQHYYDEGVRLEAEGDFAASFGAFRLSAKANPRIAAPFVGLARILMRNRQRTDAIACLKNASRCEPANIAVKIMLGQALSEDGQIDSAKAVFEEVLAKEPASIPALLGLGGLHEDRGDRGAAVDVYCQLLAAHPGQLEGLAGLLAVANGDALAMAVRDARARLRTAEDRESALLGYALGKALSRMGDTDGAFESWTLANQARCREARPFDHTSFDHRVSHICEIFSAQFIDDRRESGNLSDRPVFIVGLPRSGTTLTEQILAAHRDVHGAGELDLLSDLATGLPDRLGRADPPWPDAARDLTGEHVRRLGNDYLDRIAQISPPAASRVVDKQPLNFWNLGLLAMALPNARIIHCRRDIRDCGLSIFSEDFTPDQRWSTDLADIAHYWHGYRRLMDHWKEATSLRILDVDYEDVIADLEDQSRRLLDFIGLPWDESVIHFHKSARAVQTPSRWQVREPLYTTSKGRWRKYEHHIGPLLAAVEYADG